MARRPSSHSNYQLKWSVYRSWCRSHGHSISRPTLSKVADFLWWLRSVCGLSVSSIKGYRSMLSVVFHFQLPALSSHPVLWDWPALFPGFCSVQPVAPPFLGPSEGSVDILDLQISSSLSWRDHIVQIAKSASKKLGVLFRC